MTIHTYSRHLLAAIVVAAPLLTATTASAQTPLTFSATASVKGPSGSGSRPLTIRIDKFVSDADRDAIIAVIKARKPGETLKTLVARPDIGYVEVGDKRTPIKFAYSRSTGDGRLITFVTAQPLAYLDPGAAAKAKEGFDLALGLLVLNGQDMGDGELSPAAKVRIDDKGAVVTEEYGSEVVRLVKVAPVK
jgi:hypothetical protein